MKKLLLLIILFCIIFCISHLAFSYSGISHGGITDKVENDHKILDSYIKLLGFTSGKNHIFSIDFTGKSGKIPLPQDFENDFKHGAGSVHGFDKSIKFDYRSGNRTATFTAINWLLIGSVLEDNPIIRAAHHFHDPTTGMGLDEKCPKIIEWGSDTYLGDLKVGGPFDCKGDSSRHRAFYFTSPANAVNSAGQYQHMYFNWADGASNNEFNLRNYLYLALTSKTEKERSHYWALTLYGLGSEMHLLEDSGVPEHTRNDC